MFMGLGMPIPDLSNKPGPGRPGYGPSGSYDFQFEVSQGQVGITVLPNTGGQGFTVKWQNETEQFINAGTANLQSPTTDAGIISINKKTDPGFCDDFAVASGQQFVTKVISWGSNPWNRLVSAFKNCVNLTSVEKTKLYGVNTMMESTFEQCSSLVSADLSELNVSNNISIYRMFKDCTALQFLSIKNANSKLNLGTLGTAQSQIEAFMNVGSGVSTGCEVIIKDTEFVNARTSTTVLLDLFRNVRFKDTSDLSGLSFSGLAFDYGLLFQYAHVPQDNSFLNISNWSFNHTNEWSSQSLFFRFNDDAASGVNTDIDTTGWNFGKVTGLSQWFYYCNIRTIRGLSTWTRDNSVLFVNLFRAFNRWFNAKIPANDNFSSSFWANSRLDGNQAEMFFYAGSTSSDAETGSFPNLNGLGVNATSLIDAFRLSKWNTPVDFTGVNQYTGAGQVARTDCQRLFQSINVIGSDRRIAFNINGLKVQNARTMFYVSNVQSIDISSVVDFSTCFSFQFMFLGGTPFYDGNVTLPTNMDFSSATSWNGSTPQNQFPEISLSTCQIDNLIRRIHATLPVPPSSSVNQIYSPLSQVTEAPSVVQAQEAELVSNGWTITANSTDAALPFAYPAYMIDPDTGTTSNTPSLLPPVADRNFTSTNASITVNQNTGVLNWAAGVEGFTIVRCTYADGCYNEVSFGLQVPFVLETLVPADAGNTALTYRFNLQGHQYIEYGDGTNEFNTGSMNHTYTAEGVGFGTWRTIKIFDQSATKKFTGISAWSGYNTNPARMMRSNILKWGDIVWEFFSFRHNINPIGIRNESGDYPKFGSSLTSLEDSFNMYRDLGQINNGSGDTNTRFGDPNGSLNSWKISTASGSLGNITNFTQTFAINTMFGKSFVNDRNSQMNWNFNGATAVGRTLTNPTGSYGGRRSDRVFYVEGLASTTVTGSGILNSLRWYIIIDGDGTVSLDSNNFYAMPSVRNPGVNFQIGDTIKFSAGAFGSLSADITLTFGANDVLNSSQTPASLNWDTSNVTTFKGMFGANYSPFFTWARESVINMNNWDLSSTTSLELFGGGQFGTSAVISGSDFAPKAVSAADSSTGVAYTAWDTSNVTTFTNIKYLGDNIPGVLKYWRFNTSSNVNLFRFLNGRDLSSFVSLANEPCKTQIIASGDAGNPYGVDYTAWNMEKASNLSNFAYRTSSNTGISNFEILTPALSSWQISDSLTSFNNFAAKASGVSTFTPTVGSWDPSGITGTNIWNYTNNGDAWKFSRTTYDQLLDIANGWGQHASTVNAGVTLNMGDSKYTGNNAVIGTTTVNGTSTNLVAGGNPFTSSMVGGIVTLTSGTNNGQQAKITAFNSAGSVTISRAINIVSPPNTFTIDTTDAVKGRFALSDPDGPGWIITDGGKEVPFDPLKLQVRVPANSSLAFSFAKIMSPSNVNATLKWGDGQESTINTVNSIPTHTYTNNTGSDVDYELELNQGSDSVYCTGFRFDDNLDATSRAAVRNLTQWGSTSWISMASAFKTCSNFDITATDGPVITSSTNLTHTFGSCTSLVNSNGSMGNWDVSQLTGMYATFDNCTSFNVDISKWDTSNLANLYVAFLGATSFNQDLSTKYITAGSSPTGSAYWAWKTNNVNNSAAVFKNATSFNCGSNANGLSNWNTSNITSMQEMFENSAYNKPLNTNLVPAASSYSGSDYVAWDVQNVSNFDQMFRDNTSFNQDVGKWRFKATGTIVMSYMFRGATALAQDISTKTITAGNSPYGTQYTAWDVRRATTLTRVIAGTNVNVFLNWGTGQWSTYALHSWGGASAAGGLSVANYTDQIVKWANDVNAAGKTPTGIYAVVNGDGATVPNYDSTRTYGSGFANAGRARSYLSLDVTVSGSGDSSINGVYYYDYANAKWVRENDADIQIAWNGDESVWEVSVEGEATNSGSGGSQAGGPTSVTSWSGGIAVADSSAGWTFNGTVTT